MNLDFDKIDALPTSHTLRKSVTSGVRVSNLEHAKLSAASRSRRTPRAQGRTEALKTLREDAYPSQVSASRKRTPAVRDRASRENTHVTRERTSVTRERTPATRERTPVSRERTPVVRERTRAPRERTPLDEEEDFSVVVSGGDIEIDFSDSEKKTFIHETLIDPLSCLGIKKLVRSFRNLGKQETEILRSRYKERIKKTINDYPQLDNKDVQELIENKNCDLSAMHIKYEQLSTDVEDIKNLNKYTTILKVIWTVAEFAAEKLCGLKLVGYTKAQCALLPLYKMYIMPIVEQESAKSVQNPRYGKLYVAAICSINTLIFVLASRFSDSEATSTIMSAGNDFVSKLLTGDGTQNEGSMLDSLSGALNLAKGMFG